LPVALAVLKYGAGDFHKTLKAGVFYGRDCDSIAGMALGLYGAIYGEGALPKELRDASDVANRRNFKILADEFHDAAMKIIAEDVELQRNRIGRLGCDAK